jgi:hypothetical protein
MKPGDLFRTRCDAPPPLVEWDLVDDFGHHRVTETLPPGVPVLFLRRRSGARGRHIGLVCVLVGGRTGWVWADDLEPL